LLAQPKSCRERNSIILLRLLAQTAKRPKAPEVQPKRLRLNVVVIN